MKIEPPIEKPHAAAAHLPPTTKITFQKGESMRSAPKILIESLIDQNGSIHICELTVRATPADLFSAVPHKRAWTSTDFYSGKRNMEWAVLEIEGIGFMDCAFSKSQRIAELDIFSTCSRGGLKLVERIQAQFRSPRLGRSKPAFQILCRSIDGGLTFRDVEIPSKWRSKADDLALLYGEEFNAWSSDVGRMLKSDESGIILLSGDPGTGKTCFLRHLVATYSRKLDFIYLPPVFFVGAASPEVITTWIRRETRRRRSSVLLIEDAEDLLVDVAASGGRTSATSNLLNAADGLLGDVLKAKIICSFNCPMHRIDKAVVRPGRLKAAWKFDKLPRHRAEVVRERFDLPPLAGAGPFSLADIFQQQPLGWESLEQDGKAIGFAA